MGMAHTKALDWGFPFQPSLAQPIDSKPMGQVNMGWIGPAQLLPT